MSIVYKKQNRLHQKASESSSNTKVPHFQRKNQNHCLKIRSKGSLVALKSSIQDNNINRIEEFVKA